MANIEIDGISLEVEPGSMIIEAADKAGIPIPRFCYHKKLSVAANCRMCLIESSGAPKAVPACATPVTDGLKIQTRSPKALAAQKAVMEFLLINHPLDCPVCDQGGECELQDLALGYGKDVSRFNEGKRVVEDKDIGPLIATEFTRCIHCTRCVRFGEEVAGLRELGATGRGEHMEIGTYIAKAVDSELSGNVIDLCPVGALTAKPFLYAARAWELNQKASIAPHDCLGSNLFMHVRRDQVLRVVPRENEAINEVWLSDRDRFSYQAIHAESRLKTPRIKRNGQWLDVDWPTALEYAAVRLKEVIAAKGADKLGALASSSSTTEELFLLQKLVRKLGSAHVDHRLKQQQAASIANPPLLGCSLAELSELDSLLLIGSNLRKEQPLLSTRLLQLVKQGGQVFALNTADFAFNHPVTQWVASPAEVQQQLAELVSALLELSDVELDDATSRLFQPIEARKAVTELAQRLLAGERIAVVLGSLASSWPNYQQVEALAELVATLSGGSFGVLTYGANAAGAWQAGFVPKTTDANAGLSAVEMLANPLAAYILLGLEPELDAANPAQALASLTQADFVLSLSSFLTPTIESYAQVILPLATFAETDGSYVNCLGLEQSFEAAIHPVFDAKPGWKILRVLANMLDLAGFDYENLTQVRAELGSFQQPPRLRLPVSLAQPDPEALYRSGEWPLYQLDPLVRRAQALQQTQQAQNAQLRMNPATANKLGLREGQQVIARQQTQQVRLPVQLEPGLPDNAVAFDAGLAQGSALLSLYAPLVLDKQEV